VEAAVPHWELDIGVLERPSGDLAVSPPMESLPSTEHTFFDYQAKYADSTTVFDVPATLDPATTHAIGRDALRLFRKLGCSGLLRVDFLPPSRRHPDPQRGQHLPRLHYVSWRRPPEPSSPTTGGSEDYTIRKITNATDHLTVAPATSAALVRSVSDLLTELDTQHDRFRSR
jgi:hypothetical protein